MLQRLKYSDVSSDQTQFFLTRTEEFEGEKLKTVNLGLGKLPAQTTNKEFASYFHQNLMTEPRYIQANVNSPEIFESFNYLSSWADGFKQFEQLCKAIYFMNDTKIQPEYRDLSVGASSASYGLPPGYMCVTSDNALGCAQGLIRELAHLKLRLMGIDEKSQDSPIFINPKVKKDDPCLRDIMLNSVNQMFHEFYTGIHLLELSLSIYKTKLSSFEREQVEQLMSKNVIRMSKGVFELLPNIAYPAEFGPFMENVKKWSLDLIQQTIATLKETEYRLFNLERECNSF